MASTSTSAPDPPIVALNPSELQAIGGLVKLAALFLVREFVSGTIREAG